METRSHWPFNAIPAILNWICFYTKFSYSDLSLFFFSLFVYTTRNWPSVYFPVIFIAFLISILWQHLHTCI